MTYHGRRDHFTCDWCDAVADVAGGLPERWHWVKTGGVVKHVCAECEHKVPDEVKRTAGQKN